jgi:hypothetical protein
LWHFRAPLSAVSAEIAFSVREITAAFELWLVKAPLVALMGALYWMEWPKRMRAWSPMVAGK